MVNFHWGVEKTNTPAAYQHEYVERIVDETGTDAIVGAHPHWLQGFEFYEGVPVAYSLGNFLFPDYVSGHSAKPAFFTDLSEEDIDLSFAPYHLTNNQIVPLQGKRNKKCFNTLKTFPSMQKLMNTDMLRSHSQGFCVSFLFAYN